MEDHYKVMIDNDKISLLSLAAKMFTNTPMDGIVLLILATKHFSDQYKNPELAPEDQSGLIEMFTDVVTRSYRGTSDTQGTA